MSVAGIAVAAFEELVGIVVHELTGKDDHAGLEDTIKKIAREAFAAGEKAARDAARRELEALGLVVAFDELGDRAADVPHAFDPPAHPTVPQLGLDIEIVKETRPDWDDVATPVPDGSSEK